MTWPKLESRSRGPWPRARTASTSTGALLCPLNGRAERLNRQHRETAERFHGRHANAVLGASGGYVRARSGDLGVSARLCPPSFEPVMLASSRHRPRATRRRRTCWVGRCSTARPGSGGGGSCGSRTGTAAVTASSWSARRRASASIRRGGMPLEKAGQKCRIGARSFARGVDGRRCCRSVSITLTSRRHLEASSHLRRRDERQHSRRAG